MTKTISQLWRGNLEPIMHLGLDNIEINNMEKLMSDNFDKLKEKINEEQKEILEKYSECVSDYVLLICEQSFCDGFCLGSKISAEALVSAGRLL